MRYRTFVRKFVGTAAVVLSVAAGAPIAAMAEDDEESSPGRGRESLSQDPLTVFENTLRSIEAGADVEELPITRTDGGLEFFAQRSKGDAANGIRLPGSSSGDIEFIRNGATVVAVDIAGTDVAARKFLSRSLYFESDLPTIATLLDSDVVETFTIIQSKDDPSSWSTSLSLGEGQSLIQLPDGAAAVADGSGQPVLLIRATWARDAAGTDLPVRMAVDGSSLIFRVDHQHADVQYPILVDPKFHYLPGWNELNAAEKTYCEKPSNWISCFTAYKTDAEAAIDAANRSGLNGAHNGRRDAFRHCYWSARMRISLGATQARIFGDLHETTEGQPANEKLMDTRNNAIGRAVGSTAIQQVKLSFLEKILAGKHQHEALQSKRREWSHDKCMSRASTGTLWIINSSGTVVRG